MGNELSKPVEQAGTSIHLQASDVLVTGECARRQSQLTTAADDLLIWLDNGIHKNDSDYRMTISRLQRTVNTIGTFTEGDECIEFVKGIGNQKIRLVISGSLGQLVVPKIHQNSQLDSIFVFCGNQEWRKQWVTKWSKVRGVFTELAQMCEAIDQTIKLSEESAISIKFMASIDQTSDKKLNQLDYSFMYTQILKEILLSIEFDSEHFKRFVVYCRKRFADHAGEMANIQQFERDYSEQTPIWWYTLECFVNKILNRGLRMMDVSLIVNMGFFINDLHRQIAHLHWQQFREHHTQKKFTVYREQGLAKVDFEQLQRRKGRLMSFNNFLSTTIDRPTSLSFARESLSKPEMMGILFCMIIDPSLPTAPFASITDVSYYKKQEGEVLFSMHTVFRIDEIKPIIEHDRLYQVDLTMTSEDDRDLRLLTDCIANETKGSTGWARLSLLLVKLGQFDKATEVNEMMLSQTTNEADNTRPVASTKQKQTGCKLQKCKDRGKQRASFDSTPFSSVESCMKGGMVYYNLRNYPKALLYYERAFQVQQQSLPSNHPDLGISCNNIGDIYNRMSNYAKALSYYESALRIQRQSLTPIHPDLATTYYNIGTVHTNMQDYFQALSFYERAVDIGEESLPPNSRILQTWRQTLQRTRAHCH